MKQILQSLGDGATRLVEVPAPSCGRCQVIGRTRVSLLSAGTERMLLEFGKGNLIAKVRQQPEKAKMVLSKMASVGKIMCLSTLNPYSIGLAGGGAATMFPKGKMRSTAANKRIKKMP